MEGLSLRSRQEQWTWGSQAVVGQDECRHQLKLDLSTLRDVWSLDTCSVSGHVLGSGAERNGADISAEWG